MRELIQHVECVGFTVAVAGGVVGSDVFCVEWHCEESKLLGVVDVGLPSAFNDCSKVFAWAFVQW